MGKNKDAVTQILKSVQYMINRALTKTTKCYDGIILSQASSDKWNIQYNGETHPVKLYGSGTPSLGQMVKVIVPQGNQALAWFFL